MADADRGIEHYAFLQSLMNGERVYPRLVKHFRDADDRYNSGLFHFGEEKDRAEAPDKLTLDLDIDDKPLKEIIGSLYYPDCPYEFSVLPADILGQVYEQFLGKVIRLTAGHQAKVEEKPEVRTAIQPRFARLTTASRCPNIRRMRTQDHQALERKE